MFCLELPFPHPHPLHLPSAVIEKPGRPPQLQIYSRGQKPLRLYQQQHGGKIRRLILRQSSPFLLRVGHDLLIASDLRSIPKKLRAMPRLQIRAGPAFGTGDHATTRLCLRYLIRFLTIGRPSRPPTQVLDLGCGSGILALACARLGAQTEGWDTDPACVGESIRNARLNRLAQRSTFREADATRDPLPRADLILANLYDILLLHLLPRLEVHRRAGSTLILSGITKGQELPILRCARKLGWKLKRQGRLGRWLCLQFQS